MNKFPRIVIGVTLAASLLAGACSGTSGPRKVIVNQRVCGNLKFLQVKLGQTNRVILDNTDHSADQNGMSVSLNKFPVIVKGDIPPGSKIDSPFSTITLHAAPGESKSVDIEPTFSGSFDGTCTVTFKKPGGAGEQIKQEGLTFQFVDK